MAPRNYSPGVIKTVKSWLQRSLTASVKAIPYSNIIADKSQANGSPLFTRLPPELRLQIYKHIFDGSKMHFWPSYMVELIMFKRFVVRRRMYENVLVPTHHYNFMLTCRQAYNEARETYWSETTLQSEPSDGDFILFTRSIVPDFAKRHIKHIRGLSGLLIDNWDSVRQYLEEFPKLQSVGIGVPIINFFTDLWVGHAMPPMSQEWIERILQSRYHDEFSLLLSNSNLAVVCPVVVRCTKRNELGVRCKVDSKVILTHNKCTKQD